MKKPRLLFVVGTRPEAVKCAPVMIECKRSDLFETRLAVTSQHKELQYSVLDFFNIQPDVDFDLMAAQPDLTRLVREAWTRLSDYLQQHPFDLMAVQGDTATALIAALAAAYQKVPVMHIEAGLRTYNRDEPFPEEMNRTLITHLACLHMAPTEQAKLNLLREGIAEETIHLVGNSGIDALHQTAARVTPEQEERILSILPHPSRILLVTCHRRENWGKPLQQICAALKLLALRYPDITLVFLIHPNPIVKETVHQALEGIPNILLKPPVEYPEMAVWMKHAYLILTDSGGIQEEAPTLGKPVIVLRNRTERKEMIAACSGVLTGTQTESILQTAARFLEDEEYYRRFARVHAVFGDGKTSQRIRTQVEDFFQQQMNNTRV